MPTRADLLQHVERLLAGDFASEAEADQVLAAFTTAVPHPRAGDLIYNWSDEFDHEPTAEEIVDRALAYRAWEL